MFLRSVLEIIAVLRPVIEAISAVWSVPETPFFWSMPNHHPNHRQPPSTAKKLSELASAPTLMKRGLDAVVLPVRLGLFANQSKSSSSLY